MLKAFKEFALRGNVVDMAVGIVIGAAFSKIVNSLVNDILMPPVGMLVGRLDFSDYVIVLHKATETSEAVTLNYGLFINNIVNFVIVAFAMFILINQMNKLHKKEKVKPKDKSCPQCCSKIPLQAKRCPCCTSTIEP